MEAGGGGGAPNSALAALREDELEQLRRAYSAGVELALFDVIAICRRDGIPMPDWALEAIEACLEALYSGGAKPSRKTGRNSNAVSRYRQDLIHLARHEAVKHVQEYRATTWAEYKAALADTSLTPEVRARLEHYAPHDPGKGWDCIYEQAAAYLEGTPAYASGDMIRSSYRLVDHADDSQEQSGRFYVLSAQTRERFGIFWT